MAYHKIISRCLLAWLIVLPVVVNAVDIERAPIQYSKTSPNNVITKLQKAIESDKAKLTYDEKLGYLPAVLDALKIDRSSQVLVFSKTSFQRSRISPSTPRALYFNDDVYIGYCHNGDVLEASAADPKIGIAFYTLTQDSEMPLKFTRQTDNCLMCHGSSRTEGLPGHLLRSVYTDKSGLPVLSLGSNYVDQTTPFKERWGGWYVTGTHGKNQHLGNTFVQSKVTHESQVDLKQGQNVTSLEKLIETDEYLTPHSDLIALLVLEHQTTMHNLLTRANMNSRSALHDEKQLNKELKEKPDHRWGSTDSRMKDAVEPLVRYMLFSEEAAWDGKVTGTSSFKEDFAKRGIKDSKGRSLRDFDLNSGLFKYPCSYLIYSESFDVLPEETKSIFWKRMDEILSGKDTSKEFAHLSKYDRQAIREILSDTKPGAPVSWKVK